MADRRGHVLGNSTGRSRAASHRPCIYATPQLQGPDTHLFHSPCAILLGRWQLEDPCVVNRMASTYALPANTTARHAHDNPASSEPSFAVKPLMGGRPRGRPRGESDLGRPQSQKGAAAATFGFAPIRESSAPPPPTWVAWCWIGMIHVLICGQVMARTARGPHGAPDPSPVPLRVASLPQTARQPRCRHRTPARPACNRDSCSSAPA